MQVFKRYRNSNYILTFLVSVRHYDHDSNISEETDSLNNDPIISDVPR